MAPEDDPPPPEPPIFIPTQPGPAAKPTAENAAAPDSEAEDAWFNAGQDVSPPSTDPPAPTGAGAGEGGVNWADLPSPTVFAPAGGEPQDFANLNRAGADAGNLPPPPKAPESPGSGRVAPGAVLNHIYEVRRLVARGGMGEVYEGVNVNNTDERVAIKIILQHLAADANVLAMFRKEAGTLTRLAHPALVQYRVFTRDPALDVWFLVTEFIDGVPLAEVIGRLRPSEGEIRGLMRRLAEGLRAAHDLGAIHRDIAPDNILLPGGRLDAAKIIDFGIAKDLDVSKATIIGDGFAGKLGFVAPEQLGDFGRDVGPWTDVYSLGLVMLSLAKGQGIDMGATPVDAVDRRRHGVDLTGAPPGLHDVLAAMLAPDPKDRLRSMDAVIAALDGAPILASQPPATETSPAGDQVNKRKDPGLGARIAALPRPALVAGGALALAVVVLFSVVALSLGKPPAKTEAAPAGAGGGEKATASDASTGAAVDAALPAIACSWLEVDQSTGVDLKITGAAGDIAAAQKQLGDALRAKGINASFDFSGVAAVQPATCPTLDVLRKFRASPQEAGAWISLPAANVEDHVATFHFKDHKECNPAHQALTVINMKRSPESPDDVSLLGVDETGAAQIIFVGKAGPDGLDGLKAQWDRHPETAGMVQVSPAELNLSMCNNQVGRTGVVVVRGRNPDGAGLGLDPARPDASFSRRFETLARANGWRTQMVWFRVAEDGQ